MASWVEYYNYLMTKGDPRTNSWLLLGSPAPLLTILGTYLYFCISAGPAFMKDRKPYELKRVMQLYNFAQVSMSVFLVWEGLNSGWVGHYSFWCEPVDYSENPIAKRMAAAVWWYFFCKLTELLDTVFFVLRKKNNQVSFLHLYHHTLMPICAWIGAKFLPGGHGTLLGVINSFIHILMYSYYLIASLGPQYQKYLWWKKHLTGLQMLQFCIIAVHNLQLLYYPCSYPRVISTLLGIQAIFFFYLFGSFYVRTYIKPTFSRTHRKEAVVANGHSKTNGTKEGPLPNGKIKST